MNTNFNTPPQNQNRPGGGGMRPQPGDGFTSTFLERMREKYNLSTPKPAAKKPTPKKRKYENVVTPAVGATAPPKPQAAPRAAPRAARRTRRRVTYTNAIELYRVLSWIFVSISFAYAAWTLAEFYGGKFDSLRFIQNYIYFHLAVFLSLCAITGFLAISNFKYQLFINCIALIGMIAFVLLDHINITGFIALAGGLFTFLLTPTLPRETLRQRRSKL